MSSVLPLGSNLDASAALRAAGTHAPAGAAAGLSDAAGRAWFQGWGAEGSAGALRADVEPQAKGLSAAQHAERVLAQLVEGN
jgi:hypothetical protein